MIKSKPNRNYVQHIPSDDDLPAVSESSSMQKREVTIDSYSELISSNDESSDDRTVTIDSDSSAAQSFEDTPCKLETDSTEIEATLNQIALGLQSAAEGYLTLASHIPKLAPYELPHVIAQIPLPPINVPMPIRKALSIEGENKTIHYLLCGEYKLTNTSWSKLQQKYNVSHNTVYMALTGKGRPGGSQYQQKRKRSAKQEPQLQCPHIKLLIIKFYFICRYTAYHDVICVTRIYIFHGKCSVSVGYTTMTLCIQNPLITPSPK